MTVRDLVEALVDYGGDLEVWAVDEDGDVDLPVVGVSLFAGKVLLSVGDDS